MPQASPNLRYVNPELHWPKWRWLFLIIVQPSKELPVFCFGSGKCLSDAVLVGALHIILISTPWDFIFPFYRSQRQGEAQIFAQDPTCDRSRISNWICLTQKVCSTNLWVVWYLQTLKPLKKKKSRLDHHSRGFLWCFYFCFGVRQTWFWILVLTVRSQLSDLISISLSV